MAINAQWIPIISESLSWVSSKLVPSKKELNIKISDLEQQVQLLTAGNAALTRNLNLILQAILNQLQFSNSFVVNADTICFVGKNTGIISMEKNFIVSEKDFKGTTQSERKGGKLDVSKIFDGLDEEIAHTRISRPSDRE